MLKKAKPLILVGALALYFVLPIIAGTFAIGDKWGPKIYPISLHEPLYTFSWKLVHGGSAPRIGLWYRKAYRPWFYGMYSRNEDPLGIKKSVKEIERALEQK